VSARWEPVRDSIAAYMNIAHTYHMEDDYARELAWLDEARQLADRSDVSDLAATISHRLVEARARLLDDRQRLQQYIILAIALALVAVLASAVLLWRKNRQLRQKGRSLYEQYQQLLQADREEQQLRRSLAEAKYSRSNLTSEQRDSLLDRIRLVLADAGEVCQPEFTLAKLSKLVDSNTTYVSQAINEHYGTSFSNVLSGLRVREACRRISQEGDRYRHVTIEAIATDVGFKSRTAFTAAFKRETGLMPSEYLRMALAKE
jgi:AraC-like DNA-binding protein